MTALPAKPTKWTNFLLSIYGQAKLPVLGTVSVKEIEDKAREVMKDHLREFYHPLQATAFHSDEDASGIYVHIWKCRNVLDRCCK